MKDNLNKITGNPCEVFFTSLAEALTEIQRRRQDPELFKKVTNYLNGDVPEHFKGDKPILYLARHIATPNFETLRFIEVCKDKNLPLVISQDLKGKFVTNNALKKSLGKMSVVRSTARNGDEITENFTIINFDECQGKLFCDINTCFNEKLSDFHMCLLKEIYPKEIKVVDESDWIDKNNRENLIEQYKKMLALLIVNGIMFESYPPEEASLVKETLKPAFEYITSMFGLKPLIVELIPPHMEEEKNWNGYPSIVYPIIKNKLARK